MDSRATRQFDSLLFFLTGCLLFVGIGLCMEYASPVSMVDFGGAYYSARCLVEGHNPYNSQDLLNTYEAAGDHPKATPAFLRVVALNEHLPAAYILTVPFALLSWTPAHLAFVFATAIVFLLAAYLVWRECMARAPVLSSLLICLFLINSELILGIGNPAGISVGLCVIAVWCFIKGRFIPAGILCLAVSLAVTPHDAGLIWLYFLLSGGIYRKRALQTLAVTIILCLPAILWVSHVAPHWVTELHQNLQMAEAHGAPSDPGPDNMDALTLGALIVDLQTALSFFRDEPHFYNSVSYLICAPLMLIWGTAVLRKPTTEGGTWLGLAAMSALSMLPLYHRTHDTRLLLLVFPAFALVWAGGGAIKWLALAITGTGAAVLGVIPGVFLESFYRSFLQYPSPGAGGKVVALIFNRPMPLILLATAIFYLWAYLTRAFPSGGIALERKAFDPMRNA